MITKQGKCGIHATVIAHSVNPYGKELVTYQLLYPRFIHSEFMTHRMISKNASSSRAIPVETQIKHIQENIAMPVSWGKNQAGMQAGDENDEMVGLYDNDGYYYELPKEYAWENACTESIRIAEGFVEAGYHKQVVNRLLEPYTYINTVASGTDWDNFFYLRYHKDADPTFQELAKVMYEAYTESVPELLQEGEYHTPYVDHIRSPYSGLEYSSNDEQIELEDAIKISVSCCAQASYRKNDTSLSKALVIYDKLITSKPAHSSPTEHVATPFGIDEHFNRRNAYENLKAVGIDAPMIMYSGNFNTWTQYRKTIDGECFSSKFSV